MKTDKLYKNITIKQANILTILVIFIFTMIFVGLLVDEMYKDYNTALQQSYITSLEGFDESYIMEQNRKKLKPLMIKTALVIVTLSFIIFGIFLVLNKIFSKLLHRDTKKFLDFFERAAHNGQIIDPDLIFFKDFKIMVGYANDMVAKIDEQKKSLGELNLGLEDRVKIKTKKLQEEKRFSQELLKSQKEFLRYTVHETNTPLSVILTSIELYVMKHPKDRQLQKIEVAVKNIFNIYDDLSYLVKKDQVEYPKIVINLKDFLNSRLEFFGDVAKLSRVKFVYERVMEDVHIYFNETKLQRIVDNTITNAIKYTLIDEDIVVALNKIGASVEFSIGSRSKIIKDTKKVFEAYYREDTSHDGFGLGLQLVRNICDEENIVIEVASNDNQTTFRYKFKMMGE